MNVTDLMILLEPAADQSVSRQLQVVSAMDKEGIEGAKEEH